MDAFKANYRSGNDRYRIVDENAVIFHDEHDDQRADDFDDVWFRPEIDRGPLRDILLDSLLPDTIVWDSHIVLLQKVDNGFKLVFENGNTANADIVIGADGANSKVRPLVTSLKPFYSGVTILEGAVYNSEANAPIIHNLIKGGKVMALGHSKTLSVSAKGDGCLNFYLGFRAPEKWSKESGIDFKNGDEVLEWFKTAYAGWSSIWLELFEQEQTQFTPRPQYCMPLDQYWEPQPNITLIGDAAHLMPPYAGEGVNMAMLDALQLSESLTDENYTDLQMAIEQYEKHMFERFAKVGKDTLDNTDWMHSPDGLKMMVQMFKSLPE
jgi:2-polyprenyl-6-methoxyphenol hydroxylase-like FAD-dependent oxidoreductase